MAEQVIQLDTGDAMLLDALGAQAVALRLGDGEPEIGICLDLEGRLNKLQIRDAHRYLLAPGQAAELIAELVVAAQAAAAQSPAGRAFAVELEAAIAREQAARGFGAGGTE
jgi:hypothetical protein